MPTSNVVKPLSPLAQLGGYGLRRDANGNVIAGYMKGDGFLGPIYVTDREGYPSVVTEYSISDRFPGTGTRMMGYPSVYDGITPGDLMHVLREATGGERMPMQVEQRAYDAARARIKNGLSPFID